MNLYLLDFRERDVGGAVTPGYLSRPADGTNGRRAEDLLKTEPEIALLCHGYNVNRQEGTSRLTNLAEHLSAFATGALVAVLWPGDHWTGALSFPFEGRDADDSADALSRFIDRVVPPSTAISLATHSLGARVAMETIKRLQPGRYPFPQVCLMAAAIDDFSLASPDVYRTCSDRSGRVAVLSSRGDEVLRFAYPVGDLLQAFIFFWRERSGLALGYHGPRKTRKGDPVPHNVLDVRIPKSTNSDHGHYLPGFSLGNHDPTKRSHRNQLAAARFADQVIGGVPNPQYQTN